MFEYLNTPPDPHPPEYNCTGCGKPLYCAGLCSQCRREELFMDEIKELSAQDPREVYEDDTQWIETFPDPTEDDYDYE